MNFATSTLPDTQAIVLLAMILADEKNGSGGMLGYHVEKRTVGMEDKLFTRLGLTAIADNHHLVERDSCGSGALLIDLYLGLLQNLRNT